MFDKQRILKNFEPDERLLIAKVFNQAYLSCKNNIHTFSDFYDPFKTKLLLDHLVKSDEINVHAFGGHDCAERKQIAVCPSYDSIDENDFPISILKIIPKQNDFLKVPNHRDYLGSIVGLGIRREKIGDILIEENCAFAFVNSDIKDFIEMNLKKVCNSAVSVEEAFEFSALPSNTLEIKCIVSSLRADCIVASVCKLSRGKAQQLIDSEKIFVNYSVVKNSAQQLKVGDIITIRGFGRAVLREICGLTKKDRTVIIIEKYI